RAGRRAGFFFAAFCSGRLRRNFSCPRSSGNASKALMASSLESGREADLASFFGLGRRRDFAGVRLRFAVITWPLGAGRAAPTY
ncbi:MAG: hypothetical protein R3245_11340, partial [Kiloniellales bacterium]|nr:hypothetical protein [Kiloniellales bacterium]